MVNRRHAAEGCGGGSWPRPIPHGSSPQAAVILCSSPPPSVVFCVRVFPVELTLYIDAPLIQTYKHSSAALLPPQEDAWRSPVDVQSLRSFTGWESFCGTHLEFLCLSFIYFCGCFLGFFFQFFFLFIFFYRISYLSTTKEVSEENLTGPSPSTYVALVTWREEMNIKVIVKNISAVYKSLWMESKFT